MTETFLQGKLERQPTPYPKEMKHRIQHMRNLALKQLGIPGGKSPVSTKEEDQKVKTCTLGRP